MHPNVFSALSEYGASARENYLTESCVFLLKLLLDRVPSIGLEMINQLCGLKEEHQIRASGTVTISSQVTVDEGRPDIEIRDAAEMLVYIEVKHDSHLGTLQLERYLSDLQASGYPRTRLVLLTRSLAWSHETGLSSEEYHHTCWYNIHNWLSAIDSGDEVCQYFIQSFMAFLEEKGMSVKRVSWEYIQGVPAMMNLTDMMEAALGEALPQFQSKRTAGWSWRGLYLEGGYFCGIRYAKPLTVIFEDNNGSNPTFKRDLELEEVHFFSLTNDEQFECLVEFFRETGSVITIDRQSSIGSNEEASFPEE